jgi:hypothetical protein
MTILRNNTGQDDGVDTVSGVDWFIFNGIVASSLYVSGNSFIGFGSNSEHLKVCRRDTKMWYLYRQEGFIGVTKFLKIRWEGFAHYSQTASSYALAWELFMFDDGGLFLNLVRVPSVSGYLGTSTLTCGSKTYAYTVELATPVSYSFLPQDDGSFALSSEEYPVLTDRVPYGECEFVVDAIRAIRSVKSSYISWSETVPEGTSLSVYAALQDGAYVECRRNSAIPCLAVGDDLSDKVLRIKLTMATDDVYLSPTLEDLRIQLFDSSDVNVLVLTFDPGNRNSIQNTVGDITVAYDGTGTLMGEGGPVLAFEHNFVPEGLVPKNNPHNPEHLELVDIPTITRLSRVYYTNTNNNEHVELYDITVTHSLLHIDDI